jgi:NAD+ synthase
MDLCLFARDHGYSAAEAAAGLGLTAEQVERVYRDIEGKRRFARYLHLAPQLLETIAGKA